MPIWGWLLVFFGSLILLGFISDRISKRKRTINSRQVKNNVDEIRRNQTDYHHFH
ncbi:hypothetical protein [Fredinandcohnia sp. 179-A 10B2 NHS]|uniref:hypothetical protein n=1 Tax=Fredinandcohnia sp. 179-A 10B2 NHS TaxID=3235176 RepID=UPI0039A383CF